jgi:hypothetical protein
MSEDMMMMMMMQKKPTALRYRLAPLRAGYCCLYSPVYK